jgi:hypothetical protein
MQIDLYSTACVYALTALNLAVYAIPLVIVAYLFINRVIKVNADSIIDYGVVAEGSIAWSSQ